MSLETLNHLSFCVIDLETTGSLPQKDRIIDIGLIKVVNFEIVEEKNFLINPRMKIPHFIQRLTKIKQKDVEKAPIIDDVIDEVVDFIGDSILVAHNISFDIPFLNGVLSRIKRPLLSNNTLCTHIMTKNLIPETISSNLTYMNQLFNLPAFKAHRALEDARMTAHLLIHYLHFFEHRKLSKVNQLYYPANKFEFHKRVFSKKQKDLFVELIGKAQTPFHLSFRAGEGKVIKSFPVNSLTSAKEMIDSAMNHPDTQKMTIELLDSYFQGMLISQKHYQRLSEVDKKELVDHLELLWTSNANINYRVFELIVTKHLIPKQFCAYLPSKANSLAHKLIFKHPNHHKKFLNQVRKLKQYRKKKNNKQVDLPFEELINSYLSQSKEDYLFFSYDDVLENPDTTWEKISNTLKLQAEVSVKSFPIQYL